MTDFGTLNKWFWVNFESSSYRTEEYISFEKSYLAYFRRICKVHGWKLVRNIKGHFETDVFILGANGRYVNVLGNDVRWKDFNESTMMCYRYCKDENDYHGESNRWCHLYQLEDELVKLLG